MPFLLLLKENWKPVLLLIIALTVVAYVESLRVDIALKDNQITKLQADNATLQHNVVVLEESVKTQNAAINKIDALAATTQQNFSKLGVNVTNQGVTLTTTLTSILKEKKPVTCDDTIKYLIDARKGYTK